MKNDITQLIQYAQKLEREIEMLRGANKFMLEEEYREDYGNVIWWKVPSKVPPFIGMPLDSDFEQGYYTHFTRLIEPVGIGD